MAINILLVDDHLDTLQVFARLLRMEGWRVVTAQGARAAIQLATEERFDVLLCDMGLPDGDGCDVLRAVSAMYPIKGVAVTGFGMKEDVERSKNAGFVLHVTKPCVLSPLLPFLKAIAGEKSKAGISSCVSG